MKNLIFLIFILISASGFAQVIQIDSISIVKPGLEEVIFDPSVINSLEAFKDKDDAIVYILRLSSMVGALAKWQIKVDTKVVANLKQKEYVVVHVNTTVKGHYFYFPSLRYNYTNFKPNRYYYIMLNQGFGFTSGYLNEEVLSELKSCNVSKPIAK
jgi:hypothetical protein